VAGLDIERYVVISMSVAAPAPAGATVIHLPSDPGALPIAAARNRALAEMADVDLAIMLDVDCIPGPELITRYGAAARAGRLLCGPIAYLDPLACDTLEPDAEQRRRARARVIRTFPATGDARETRHELFWSTSFAVTPSDHQRIGGFDEQYRGWGAEDTDYGLRAAQSGIELRLVAGAWAYHQHHDPTPPNDIKNVAANARRFHARHGFWPMPDQLARLAASGQLQWTPEHGDCRCSDPRSPGPVKERAHRRLLDRHAGQQPRLDQLPDDA
jgi:N-acetylglucosaminyl-diphospho-decaprenol L-rhamnosyltransferase